MPTRAVTGPGSDAPVHATVDEEGRPGGGTTEALHSSGYLTLLLTAALLGIPLSLVAFAFLVVVHELERAVWHDLPRAMGYAAPPAWWAIVTIGFAGLLVALAVKHLPGHGGHVPIEGLGAGATAPSALPGIVLAAGASLVGGAVVGPEAPLIALGSGLALLAVRRTRSGVDATTSTVLAAAGSAAAISAIFGSPLVAAVIFLEVLGLSRRGLMLVVLPCLVSSGVGALLFTGLGRWTGLQIGALALPGIDPGRLEVAEVAWALPLALVVALMTWSVYVVGRRTARLAESRVMTVTLAAGVTAGAAAAAYSLLTGRSPADVALSGQTTLVAVAQDPGAWSTEALLALLVCKAVAYAVCLGTFRGGPAFPAILLGAVTGVLAAGLLPGLGLPAALATGMAAGMAVTGLPVTSVVLVVVLLGDAASSYVPVVILAVVTAIVVEELLSSWLRPRADARDETPVEATT